MDHSYEYQHNGVLVERIIDHGDGTGTRIIYDDKGQDRFVEEVTIPLDDE